MSVSISIPPIQTFKTNLANLSAEHRNRLKMALDSVLIEIVNYAKQSGQWTDRTSNLRNSISYTGSVSEINTYPASENKIEHPVAIGDGSQWVGNELKGVVFAGMEYAVYVEYKEGHWVLSCAFDEFRPKIMKLIAERCMF